MPDRPHGPSGSRRIEAVDSDACIDLLRTVPVGRVVVPAESGPLVVPVNFAVDGWSIVFRSGPGSKLVAAASGHEVAFEADDFDASSRTGWSVVAHGVAEFVDGTTTAHLDRLGLSTWFTDPGSELRWVRVHPNEITGRRVL